MDPTIRRAAGADAPAIAGLMAQLGYPVCAATIEGRLARLDGRRVVFVAADETTILG